MFEFILGSWKRSLIEVVVVLVAFGAGYTLGHKDGTIHEVRHEVQVQTKYVDRIVTEVHERQVRDLKREQELSAKLESARQGNSSLQARLADAANRGIDPSLSDRLSVGSVSLLNTSALGGTPETSSSGGLDGTFETPSEVTAQDFVSWGLDVTEQYNELAVKHDALVDWVNEELIHEH